MNVTSAISPPITETQIEVRVRYCECDPMNVAHHSVYPVWMEMARTELLRQRGIRYRDLEAQGMLIMVARMSLRYRKPAYYDDVLHVTIKVLPSAGVKLEHRYRISRGKDLLAQADTTVVCTDRNGKLLPVPDFLLSVG